MKILRINMSTLTSSMEDLPDEWKIVGGRGLSAKILNAEVSPTIDPLGPDAKIVLATGPLGGTMAPSFGRMSVGAKSPLTMGIKEANVGGPAGQKLNKLGIRAIVLEGVPKNGKLHVLSLTKDGVSFDDGEPYRGKGTYDLGDALRKKYDKNSTFISIGVVGERKQKAASVAFTDKDGHPSRHAARGGLGAVMGSKGVKAIVVDDKGTPAMEIADKKGFRDAVKGWTEPLKADGSVQMMGNVGTPGVLPLVSRMGSTPFKNYSGEPVEGVENLYGDSIKKKGEERGGRMDACMNGCLVKCSVIVHDEKGEHVTSAFEYESIALLGTNLGVSDMDAVARWDRQCDNMGIDTIELGSALGVASAGGKFEFGDVAAVQALLDEVEQGTEFGLILADGVVNTAKHLGVTRVPAFKGQAIPAHDPRVGKPTGVTYATSPMGADHTAGIKYEMKDEGATEHSLREQIYNAMLDTLGLCNFAVTADRKLLVNFIKNLLNALQGTSVTDDDVVNVGRECLRDELKFNEKAEFSTIHGPDPEFVRTEVLPPMGMIFKVDQAEMDSIWENLDSVAVL